jgi:hypothetical protein
MEKKITDAMMEASRPLLDKLCELTNQRNLSWGRANPRMTDSSSAFFKHHLSSNAGSHLSAMLDINIRLVEPHSSYVEAAFRLSDEPIPINFQEPCYRGPAADTNRLKEEVVGKAGEIFATALTHLRRLQEEEHK